MRTNERCVIQTHRGRKDARLSGCHDSKGHTKPLNCRGCSKIQRTFSNVKDVKREQGRNSLYPSFTHYMQIL